MRPFSVWLDKVSKVHKGFFKYPDQPWHGMKTKVTITCPVHGDFQQGADLHARGRGCFKCNHARGRSKVALTTEQWVAKARAIWGERYDYSKAAYTKSDQAVTVICADHGEFNVVAREHIRSGGAAKATGCPTCGGNKPVPFDTWRLRALEVHGDKYDYTLTEKHWPNRQHDTVKIKCPTHGIFSQTVHVHVHTRSGSRVGGGCPECGKESALRQRLAALEANPDAARPSFNRKPYKWGRETLLLQGYEGFALDHLRTLGYKRGQVATSHKEGIPVVRYYFDGDRRYYPDFFLPATNTVIEVKSTYTWRAENSHQKNLAKLNASLLHHNVWLLIMNTDGTVHRSTYRERRDLFALPAIAR